MVNNKYYLSRLTFRDDELKTVEANFENTLIFIFMDTDTNIEHINCENCHANISTGYNFCDNCGNRIDTGKFINFVYLFYILLEGQPELN